MLGRLVPPEPGDRAGEGLPTAGADADGAALADDEGAGVTSATPERGAAGSDGGWADPWAGAPAVGVAAAVGSSSLDEATSAMVPAAAASTAPTMAHRLNGEGGSKETALP
jgi:hypothetical protein